MTGIKRPNKDQLKSALRTRFDSIKQTRSYVRADHTAGKISDVERDDLMDQLRQQEKAIEKECNSCGVDYLEFVFT